MDVLTEFVLLLSCCLTPHFTPAPVDAHVLASLPWSSVVVDRRQRSRSAAGKAQLALQVGVCM